MSKTRRFSLPARLLSSICVFALIGVLIVFAVAGFGAISGVVLAAAVTGLAVPAVLSGGSLLEMLAAMLELAAEGIGTLIDAITEFLLSLFG